MLKKTAPFDNWSNQQWIHHHVNNAIQQLLKLLAKDFSQPKERYLDYRVFDFSNTTTTMTERRIKICRAISMIEIIRMVNCRVHNCYTRASWDEYFTKLMLQYDKLDEDPAPDGRQIGISTYLLFRLSYDIYHHINGSDKPLFKIVD